MFEKPRIYLAGPTVFLENPEVIFDEMRDICAKYGIEVVAPIDNQLDMSGVKAGKELGMKIVEADRLLMDELDGAILCVDSWRGAEMDTGTAVELGYLRALNKPMIGWVTDARPYPDKTKEHYNNVTVIASFNEKGATSGHERASDGSLIHSEGFIVHGMAQGFIEQTGGKIVYGETWQQAFEQAAISMKELWAKRLEHNQESHPKP